jgi:hypothetical protein
MPWGRQQICVAAVSQQGSSFPETAAIQYYSVLNILKIKLYNIINIL